MKKYYDLRVLDEFLEVEPPHLSFIRAIESACYQKYLPLQGKILDVGCGDGFFAQAVFKGQIIDLGIDINGSLWPEAKKRGNYRQVREYDGKTIPAEDKSFDTVICNCVLEHVVQADKLISEMARVLKTGGVLITTVVTDNFGDELWGSKILGKRYKDWFNKKSLHVANTSKLNWIDYFERNGLKVKEVKTYMDQGHLIKWFDISHYWGISNLVSRKMNGKWVFGVSRLSNRLWKKITIKVFEYRSKKEAPPYLFFRAEKIKT